jgi:DNA repair exonuclease SbcCD ATPase subunit
VIIEGFEIENWACIQKLAVSGLPHKGVIVLHGPNRTGKTSLVRALRACLMDYASTTTALKSCYPRGSGEKPSVCATFVSEGVTYRIKKCFGTNKSELARRTSTGAWKVETNAAAEAHRLVCHHAGGDDSMMGLRQLLWLTQGEFRLPDPKKFDAGVQAQLRAILGVLQTPLDDHFIERIKERWKTWYSGQRKAGKQHHIKSNCQLAEQLKVLEKAQADLNETEGKFSTVEGLLRTTAELEARKLDLEGQLVAQTTALRERQEEFQRSQIRIAARRLAEEQNRNAVNEHHGALQEQRLRREAAQRSLEDDRAMEPAQKKLKEIGKLVEDAENRLKILRENIARQRDRQRNLQRQAASVATKLRSLQLAERLAIAGIELDKAGSIVKEIAAIKKYLEDHPAPDEKMLEHIKTNRQHALRLQADLEAASMDLTLTPEKKASAAQLGIDGGPLLSVQLSNARITQAVRRKAELNIDGWGRVELSRGNGSNDLDLIEKELRQCTEDFDRAVNALGITTADSRALDLLLVCAAEHRERRQALVKLEKDLAERAPNGLDCLRTKVMELQTQVADLQARDRGQAEALPADQSELEELATSLACRARAKDEEIKALEKDQEGTETNLEAVRREETVAREERATCKARLDRSRAELDRLRSDEEIEQRVCATNSAMEVAQAQLQQSELTAEESTIDERLSACKAAVIAVQEQVRENEEKYNKIRGRLEESAGLHAQRASLSARVDELCRVTKRESLERDAVDRLYELFEESREKQLGTLMGPIHDRILDWMRILNIGDYKEVRFSDAFLPDKLVKRDETAEFGIDEESTGAQEQIGMLVRLALGSILTSTADPAVAILDDPLTHCDVGRLNKMRLILRRAGESDVNLSPPAGPLQIIIVTCHPEWFRDEGATVIDLENPDVMRRFPD